MLRGLPAASIAPIVRQNATMRRSETLAATDMSEARRRISDLGREKERKIPGRYAMFSADKAKELTMKITRTLTMMAVIGGLLALAAPAEAQRRGGNRGGGNMGQGNRGNFNNGHTTFATTRHFG